MVLWLLCSGEALSAIARVEPCGEQRPSHFEGVVAVGLLALAAWLGVFAYCTSAAVLSLVG